MIFRLFRNGLLLRAWFVEFTSRKRRIVVNITDTSIKRSYLVFSSWFILLGYRLFSAFIQFILFIVLSSFCNFLKWWHSGIAFVSGTSDFRYFERMLNTVFNYLRYWILHERQRRVNGRRWMMPWLYNLWKMMFSIRVVYIVRFFNLHVFFVASCFVL